jgi:hypothetical protein
MVAVVNEGSDMRYRITNNEGWEKEEDEEDG